MSIDYEQLVQKRMISRTDIAQIIVYHSGSCEMRDLGKIKNELILYIVLYAFMIVLESMI